MLQLWLCQYIFFDELKVIAKACEDLHINAEKVQQVINWMQSELTGEFALMFNRKADDLVVPLEV